MGRLTNTSRSRFINIIPHQEGEEVSWKSSGWEARILQHEVDHLHGKMFIDKVMPIVKEVLVIMFFSLIFLCNNSAFYPHN